MEVFSNGEELEGSEGQEVILGEFIVPVDEANSHNGYILIGTDESSEVNQSRNVEIDQIQAVELHQIFSNEDDQIPVIEVDENFSDEQIKIIVLDERTGTTEEIYVSAIPYMNRDVDYVQLDSSDQNSNQSATECSNYDSFEQGLSDQNRPKGEQFRMSGNDAGTFPNLFQSTFCASSEQQKTSVDSISGFFHQKSHLQIALERLIEDEERNGNLLVESMSRALPDDFGLDFGVSHWPLYPNCSAQLPCIHSIVQHDLPRRFFNTENNLRFSQNLAYKYEAKLTRRFPADSMLEQGGYPIIGNTKLIKIGCPADSPLRLPKLMPDVKPKLRKSKRDLGKVVHLPERTSQSTVTTIPSTRGFDRPSTATTMSSVTTPTATLPTAHYQTNPRGCSNNDEQSRLQHTFPENSTINNDIFQLEDAGVKDQSESLSKVVQENLDGSKGCQFNLNNLGMKNDHTRPDLTPLDSFNPSQRTLRMASLPNPPGSSRLPKERAPKERNPKEVLQPCISYFNTGGKPKERLQQNSGQDGSYQNRAWPNRNVDSFDNSRFDQVDDSAAFLQKSDAQNASQETNHLRPNVTSYARPKLVSTHQALPHSYPPNPFAANCHSQSRSSIQNQDENSKPRIGSWQENFRSQSADVVNKVPQSNLYLPSLRDTSVQASWRFSDESDIEEIPSDSQNTIPMSRPKQTLNVNHAKENPSLAAEMKTQPGPKKVPRRGIVQRSSLGSINKESGGNCKIELMDMSHPDPGVEGLLSLQEGWRCNPNLFKVEEEKHIRIQEKYGSFPRTEIARAIPPNLAYPVRSVEKMKYLVQAADKFRSHEQEQNKFKSSLPERTTYSRQAKSLHLHEPPHQQYREDQAGSGTSAKIEPLQFRQSSGSEKTRTSLGSQSSKSFNGLQEKHPNVFPRKRGRPRLIQIDPDQNANDVSRGSKNVSHRQTSDRSTNPQTRSQAQKNYSQVHPSGSVSNLESSRQQILLPQVKRSKHA